MKDYQIIGKLESGFNGLVYFIKTENDNKVYILKRQKILASQRKKNYDHEVWREIDFSEKVNLMNQNDQKFFMIIYDYNIIKCTDKLEFYQQFEVILQDKNIKKLYDSNWCLDIIYQYKNQPIYDLIKKNKLSLKDIYHLIIQVLHAIILMKNEGYTHNDLHFNNIMYQKATHPIKIGKHTIKSKYQYSLIDYGLVNHKKYPSKKNDIDFEQLSLFLSYLSKVNIIMEIYQDNNWQIPDILMDPFSKNDIYQIMYSDTKIWNKIKRKLSKIYPEFIKLFDFMDKCENHKNITDFIWAKENLHINYLLIEMLYISYNSKKFYRDILQLKKVRKFNLIPEKDIEYFVLNISNYPKLLKYFIKKANQL